MILGRGICKEEKRLSTEPYPVGNSMISVSELWDPEGSETVAIESLHTFSWLRDLRVVGDNSARKIARQLIQNWVKRNRDWLSLSWRPDILGQRLSIWIGLYDFFGASAEDAFQKLFMKSLMRQYRHLKKSFCFAETPLQKFFALKGLIFATATLTDDKTSLEKYMGILKKELETQIWLMGGIYLVRHLFSWSSCAILLISGHFCGLFHILCRWSYRKRLGRWPRLSVYSAMETDLWRSLAGVLRQRQV